MDGSRFIELARRMIRTPSVTHEGTRALATFLASEVLAESDLAVVLQAGPAESQVNLVATKGLGTEPPILLNSHLDTVPPGEAALWTECGGDPFRAEHRGDRLYGLGSADAKLDWLCKAAALRRFEGRRFRRGVILAGTFGEESGLRGARLLLPHLPERPVAAWVGEPTQLAVVTRHKGLLVLSITARDREPAGGEPEPTTRLTLFGRSAHSSTPHLGDNAIFRALDLAGEQGLAIVSIRGGDAANKVPERCELEVAGAPSIVSGATITGTGHGRHLSPPLQDFLVGVAAEVRRIGAETAPRDVSFSPPTLTASLGRLEAEAGEARVLCDARSLPGDPSARIRARFERFADEHRRSGLDIALSVERDNPPLLAAEDSFPVVRTIEALAALGLSTDLRTKAGCTEAGVYSSAGIPSVVLGPGVSAGNVHAPNEHVSIPQLEGAIEVYARLIEELCLE